MKANFTLFLTAIFLVAIWWGWEWPYIAKLMPIYVAAIPGVILAFVQLGREATSWEERRESQAHGIEMDETHNVSIDQKSELRRTLAFFAWFVGGAVGIWLLGIVIALPLLVFLYMLVEGRERVVPVFVMTACTYGVIWGLFEYTLEMRWPAGQLFGY
jgi:hypothetical protein